MPRSFDDAVPHYLVGEFAPVTAYPLTFGAWFRSDTIEGGEQTLIWLGDKDVDNHRHHLFLRGTTGVVVYVCTSGSGTEVQTTTTWSTNTWHLAVAVGTSATSRAVFLDAGGKGTTTASRNPTGLDRYSIGMRRSLTPGIEMSGMIDRAFIYNVALTDAEVLALWQTGSPMRVRRAALVDYRKLGYFDPEPNWVGPGNGMTVVGATRAYGTPGALERRYWSIPHVAEAEVILLPTGTEATTVAEVITPRLSMEPRMSEAVALTESPMMHILIQPTFTDAITTGELITPRLLIEPQRSESVSVAEVITCSNPVLPAVSLEAVTVVEVSAVEGLTAGDPQPSVSDPVVLGEVISIALIGAMTITTGVGEWPWVAGTLTDLVGASVTATGLIPADCWVLGVTVDVLSTVTGTTAFHVGLAGSPERFGSGISPSAGTMTNLVNNTPLAIASYGTATDVLLTAVGGDFTGGTVMIRIFYATLLEGLYGEPWPTATATLSGLSGASQVATDLIPGNAWLIGVRTEVLTTVTGATGIDVGIAVSPDPFVALWGENISPSASTTTDIGDFQMTTLPSYGVDTSVVIQAVGGDFTGGDVRLTAYYADLTLSWPRRIATLTGLSGASVAAANLIQPGEWVIGVTIETLTTVTGATGIDVGDEAASQLWGANIPVAASTMTDLSDILVTTPTHYASAADVVLRPVGANFSGGNVRVTIYVTGLTLVLAPSGTEAFTLTDTHTLHITLPPSGTEALLLAEVSAMALALPSVGQEAITLTDMMTVGLSLLTGLTESITVVDVVLPSLLIQPQPSDAITLTETGIASPLLAPLSSEAVISQDLLTVNLLLQPTLVEDLSLAEVDSIALPLLGVLTEHVILADVSTAVVPLLPASVIDAITIGDVLGVGIPLTRLLTDAVTVAEMIIQHMLVQPAAAEAITLTEVVDTDISLFIARTDAVIIAELSTLSLPLLSTALDAIMVDEAHTLQFSLLLPSSLDAITVGESPFVIIPQIGFLTMLGIDAVVVAETEAITLTLPAIGLELVTITEQLTLGINLPLVGVDLVDVDEAIFLGLPLLGAASESVVLAEQVTSALALPAMSVDALMLTESSGLDVMLLATSLDAIVVDESAISVLTQVDTLMLLSLDAVILAEQHLITLALPAMSLDAVTVAEIETIVLTQVGFLILSGNEFITVDELSRIGLGLTLFSIDPITLAEDATVGAAMRPQAVDALTVEDVITVGELRLPALAGELVTSDETLTLDLALPVIGTDAAVVEDVIGVDLLLQPTMTDAIAVNELLDTPVLSLWMLGIENLALGELLGIFGLTAPPVIAGIIQAGSESVGRAGVGNEALHRASVALESVDGAGVALESVNGGGVALELVNGTGVDDEFLDHG